MRYGSSAGESREELSQLMSTWGYSKCYRIKARKCKEKGKEEKREKMCGLVNELVGSEEEVKEIIAGELGRT